MRHGPRTTRPPLGHTVTCQQCFLQRLIEILQNVREDLQSIIILTRIRNPAPKLLQGDSNGS